MGISPSLRTSDYLNSRQDLLVGDADAADICDLDMVLRRKSSCWTKWIMAGDAAFVLKASAVSNLSIEKDEHRSVGVPRQRCLVAAGAPRAYAGTREVAAQGDVDGFSMPMRARREDNHWPHRGSKVGRRGPADVFRPTGATSANPRVPRAGAAEDLDLVAAAKRAQARLPRPSVARARGAPSLEHRVQRSQTTNALEKGWNSSQLLAIGTRN